jgi:hypothetical protein
MPNDIVTPPLPQDEEIEGEEKPESPPDVIYEIKTLVELLEQSLSDPFIQVWRALRLEF